MTTRQFSLSIFLMYCAAIVHLGRITVRPEALPLKAGAIAMMAAVCIYIVVRMALDRYKGERGRG